MQKEPTVAGRFYEAERTALHEQVKACFTERNGPGLPAKHPKKRRVLGAIIPHAGLQFSGMCAAHCYKEIAEQKEIPVFLILGVNHSGRGRTSVLLQDHETPLGLVRVEEALGKLIMEHTGIPDDQVAHRHEHSIEVQLPFLRFLYGDEASFVPLSVKDDVDLQKLAQGIREAIATFKATAGKQVCVIASADLTHYGPQYGYVPFKEDVKKQLEALDKATIATILKHDVNAFIGHLNRTKATVCGAFTIQLLLHILGKDNSARLLKYYTSGDILEDWENAVSYASISFKEE